MLLDITKAADVDAPSSVAWALFRDVPRLSACIPNVADLKEVEPDKKYTAKVADKLGPFKLEVPVNIQVLSVEEPRRIVAEHTGNDNKGAARVKGTLEGTVDPTAEGGSHLSLSMKLEVLGKLAALGAAPMRRRADEIFNDFLRRVQKELATTAGEGQTGNA